eukprot:m.283252 g.283252  ORF g.283252 m.283252 type:complete len:82 (-) comp81911_c0_seq1:18-263(-)
MGGPVTLRIKEGDTVVWRIHGRHAVNSGHNGIYDGLFTSGRPGMREVFAHTFKQRGTFPFFCPAHAGILVGKVIVGSESAL